LITVSAAMTSACNGKPIKRAFIFLFRIIYLTLHLFCANACQVKGRETEIEKFDRKV